MRGGRETYKKKPGRLNSFYGEGETTAVDHLSENAAKRDNKFSSAAKPGKKGCSGQMLALCVQYYNMGPDLNSKNFSLKTSVTKQLKLSFKGA